MKGGPPLLVLVLLASVSPLATDLYTPAFPSMATSLGASEATIQLSFSTFIIGMGLGQLVVGPLSDGIGRRPFIIGGASAFVVLSLLCAVAPTATLLVLFRLAQGCAGACCLVMARAVITDHYEPVDAARRYGTVAAVQSLAPVLGPTLGAMILLVGDWRTVFLAVAGVGAVMAIGGIAFVPETLPRERRSGTGLRDNLHRMRTLLSDLRFMRYVAVAALACAGFFTYIAGAPLVMTAVYGLSAQDYGLFFAVNAVGMAVMIAAARLLAVRVRPTLVLTVGLCLASFSTLTLVIVSLFGSPPLAVAWGCLIGVTCGVGLINPTCLILSQRAGAVFAGTAAALHGGIQFTSGAIASPSTGLLGHTTLTPMAAVMAAFFVLGLLTHVVTQRRGTAA